MGQAPGRVARARPAQSPASRGQHAALPALVHEASVGIEGTDIKAGIEATNTVIQSYIEATTSLAKVPKQANKLVKQAKALPKQLKSDLLANPAQAITIAKNLGVVKDNIKIATQIPKRSIRVTKNLNKDMKVIVTAFGGKWPPI